MKKVRKVKRSVEMLPEYDFRGGIRGKYYERALKAKNFVVLDPDVLEVFPDSEAVNDALRVLIRVASKRRRSA